ncbi:orotate phosphoribosyltransferase [Clostridia bacterium]|nr:orotate phosphoribosyltransferase [Clostridia bacterium]
MSISSQIARDLLDIRAVFLRPSEPFTWASGIKSPVYCDNRLILSQPEIRTRVENALAETISREFPSVDAIIGAATAGIAHAALVAHLMNLPSGYVRAQPKDHGRGNQIEGSIQKGANVVLVEDLISTGGSSLACVDALRDAGANVLGVVSIFTYGMKKAAEAFDNAGMRLVSLTDFDALIDEAAALGYIDPSWKDKLLAFRNNPSDPSWMN